MRWKYPLSDIDLGKEEEREVLKVLRSRWLSTGPVTEKFEKTFSEFLGGGEAIAVSNGTAALHLGLSSLGLKEGDEVILPSFTFVATANAVLYNGAKPVFADILGVEDLNISPKEIENRITQKTKAIVVMHYGGYPCDMEMILKIAKRYGLPVAEDAAHAPGSEYQGQKCGTLGRVGCFSFFSNKNLVTGEGGMVFTRDQGLAKRMRTLRSHGMKSLSWDKFRGHLSSYDIEVLGYNYRITEIQSILGLVQLKKLERNNRRRKRLVAVYRQELRGIPGVFIPFVTLTGSYSYHLFPIVIEGGSKRKSSFLRDQLMIKLRDLGIQTSIHYPPVHLFSLYRRQFGYRTGTLPMSEAVSQRLVTLPLHPRMDANDVKWITQKVKEIVRRWN
ncbi:MAG TPA: DegT/DnrJ/EryC1/StrS family aminotransferase [Thermodesulfobacteriota bacterium]|nr:DegT/DnrJ/EryC1/StrS family aminotransferase [Thermodesulfobacteriota bacterium]